MWALDGNQTHLLSISASKMQVGAARADKVKRSTWGQMESQERIITPLQEYRPVSGLDASDQKTVGNPSVLMSVTNFALERPGPAASAAITQMAFLRQVEQVRICSWPPLAWTCRHFLRSIYSCADSAFLCIFCWGDTIRQWDACCHCNLDGHEVQPAVHKVQNDAYAGRMGHQA